MRYRRETPRWQRVLLVLLSCCLVGILVYQRGREREGPPGRADGAPYGGFVQRFAPPVRGAPPVVREGEGEAVAVDVDAFLSTMRAGRLVAFDLGGDLLRGRIERVEVRGEERLWSGWLSDEPGEFAFLMQDGTLAGRIDLYAEGRRFFVEAGPEGHRIHEVPAGTGQSCALGSGDGGGRVLPAPPVEVADTPRAGQRIVEVEVGVFWTRAARLGANRGREQGSAAAMRSLLNQAAFTATEAFWTATAPTRSPVRVVLRIHPAGEVDYRESGDDATDLDRLTARSDGHLDGVHEVRRRRRFDIVVLMVEKLDSGGRAWVMGADDGPEFADKAFAIVERASASSMHNLAHEIAHIFGAGHDESSPRLYPFSAGWRFQIGSVAFHTIMAYRARPDERPYPSFSDPARTLTPGVGAAPPVTLGKPGAADNALTIQLTAPVIAAFM